MTENENERTTKTFAFVDTIDDLESERKQTGTYKYLFGEQLSK